MSSLFEPDSVGPKEGADSSGRDKNKDAEESVGALILRLRKYNGADNDGAANTDPRIEPEGRGG